MKVLALLHRRYSNRLLFAGLILANIVLVCYYLRMAPKRGVSYTATTTRYATGALMSPSVQLCPGEKEDVMFKYADAIYSLVGKTELLQYNRFMQVNRRFKLTFGKVGVVEVPDRFRYQVSLTLNVTFNQYSGFRIVIVERDGETATGGGSSFTVTSESVSRLLCPYQDHFNGTYSVWCPSPNSGCRNVSIRLQYFNFTAYTGNHIPIGKLIWTQCVCNSQESVGAVSSNARLITWYRSRDSWSARTIDGQQFYYLSAAAFRTCVTQYDRLIFVGSSHMRYKANYVMHQCFDMPQRYLPRDRSLSIGNVHFVYTSKSLDYATVWKNVLQQMNLTKRDMVIFQTGAHDMADFGIQESMGKSLDVYVSALTDMARRSIESGFRMLVVTSPPFPDADVRQSKGSRNNFALAAYARVVTDKLRSITVSLSGFSVSKLKRVRLFDEFSLLVTLQEEISCGCHYMCYSWGNGVNTVSGDVGITAVQLMMVNYIC